MSLNDYHAVIKHAEDACKQVRYESAQREIREAKEENYYYEYNPDTKFVLKRPDWWPDGSLKYNGTYNNQRIKLPRGMFWVNADGEDVHGNKAPEKLRPPHPIKESEKYKIWIEAIKPLCNEQAQKDLEQDLRKAQEAKRKADEQKRYIEATLDPSLSHPVRVSMRNEILECKHNNTLPEITIRDLPKPHKFKEFFEVFFSKDTIVVTLIFAFFGYLFGVWLIVKITSDNLNLGATLLLGVLFIPIPYLIFYLLCNSGGNSTALTDSGACQKNYLKAKEANCFYNPPEDYKNSIGTLNWKFYPDGSLKYIDRGNVNIQLPQKLYYVDYMGRTAENSTDCKLRRPPNPDLEPEKFQIWLDEVNRLHSEGKI